MREEASNKCALVKLISQVAPALAGILLLFMIALDQGEILWIKVLAVVLHVGYWVVVVIWGLKGAEWMNHWQAETLNHQHRMYQGSDLLYLILEHEQPEPLDKKQDWVEKLTSSRVPADSSFKGRIRWFLANHKVVTTRAGVSAAPEGRVYRFSELTSLMPFLPLIFINVMEKIAGDVIGIFLVFHLFMAPVVLTLTLEFLIRYSLAIATADVLLGDVETAPDEDKDAGAGEND